MESNAFHVYVASTPLRTPFHRALFAHSAPRSRSYWLPTPANGTTCPFEAFNSTASIYIDQDTMEVPLLDQSTFQYTVGVKETPPDSDVAEVTTSPRQTQSVTHRVQTMLKAATLDPQRIAHATLGVASLLLGLYHAMDCVVHGFEAPISQTDILVQGSVHTACAVMGLPRIDLTRARDWTRNVIFSMIFFFNAWFTASSLTEWAQGSRNLLSIDSDGMIGFTLLACCLPLVAVFLSLTVHQRPGDVQSGLWSETPYVNSCMVFFNMGLFYIFPFLFYLFGALFVDMEAYTALIDRYPDMGYCIANAHLDTAFIGNLVVFLNTNVKYKVVQRSEWVTLVPIPLFLILAEYIVMPANRRAGGGEVYPAFLDLMAQSLPLHPPMHHLPNLL